jgi:hypothetical protein
MKINGAAPAAKFTIAILVSVMLVAATLVFAPSTVLAQNQPILDALRALNNMPERFNTPAEAEATAKEFFELVQSSSGNENVIEALKQVKRGVPQAEWNDNCRRAENLLMHTVQQTLDGTMVETIRSRATSKTLGSIHGYGYSGKWPIKPETQLTFDGDFDASLFGTELTDTDPQNSKGIIQDINGRLRTRLGTGPAGLGIVLNGFGWEGRADVYVTSAGKQWAIRQSMTRLYLIDPVTGAPINITAIPGALFAETQIRLLNKLHPELFENGRLREGVTPEEMRRVLMEDPRLGEVWKVWLSGTRYTPGQAAAGVIDFLCHVAEVAEATTTLEQRTKVAKQMARAANVFLNAMDDSKLPWREFFSETELTFMRDCATLDRAKITYAEAAEQRVNLLRRLKGREWSPADIEAYDRLVTASQNALNDLTAAERRVMAVGGGEAAFVDSAVKIMRRQAQVAHREFVLDIMGRPAAERGRLLQQYESDLRALLDHYSKRQNVPQEAMAWANDALESVKELNRIANERAAALEGFGTKFKRLWGMFNEPANTRENVRKILGDTPIGEALIKKIPEWAFDSSRPPALTDIAFASPAKLVAEMVVTEVNRPVNALMMFDLLWQLTDIWRDNTTTNVQKLVSTGGITAMLVIPHLYLVPMIYHASLQGDPRQLTYVMACFICPAAMLPMLVESMGTRIISGAKNALFQKELEAMFLASTFNPDRGKEPTEWAQNRDAVRYTWMVLNTELDTYGREGERNLATYIRILSSDTRGEVPLSQPQKMSGFQAIYLPGGVAKSFRAMIEDGDHRLFREHGGLANAMAALQKFNCDRMVPYMDRAPANCFGAWAVKKDGGIKIDLINNSLADGEADRLRSEGKSGENILSIVNAMLLERGKLQEAVIQQLAEAIMISFEEEARARKLVELGLMDDVLKELLDIGEELGIKDELVAAFQDALRQEQGVKVSTEELQKPGGPEAGQTAKTKEAIAKVADTWLKAYRQVRTTRRFLTGLAGGYGVPQSDLDRFLHGTPPLVVNPGKDAEIAQVSQEVLLAAPKSASAIIFGFKGNSLTPDPRDNEAEQTLLKYLFTARMMELIVGMQYTMTPMWSDGPAEGEAPTGFADRVTAEMKRQLDMKHKSLFRSTPDFTAFLDRYYILARGYAEKFADLRELYRGGLQLTVDGPTEVEAMKDVNLKVAAKRAGKPADDALKDARVEWTVNKAVQNSGPTWWFSPLQETVMTITITATKDIAGKKIVLGSTTHQLKVNKPKDDKKDDTTDTKKDDKKDAVSTAPTCSYEYTDYGECVRATKKQTRTVKATTPAGCVERQKPALERGCNPPPTEEDKRNSYLNCLCRCSCGWAGHIGVWYDPEQKTIPECKSSGPCIGGIGAWGCSSRHFFIAPNDCAKGCWEGVYGKGTYDPDKADKIRKEENKKFKKPITMTIKASKNPADFGDIVNLTAETAEGSGGYKWTWGGCAQDPKDATAKVLNSRECKPCTATVTVTDQDGDSASASLEVKCTALKVKLTKEKPKENTVPIGGQATFLAEVFSDDKPAPGSFSYIWERNPDALFGDPKNPTYETKGGSQSRNTATFKKTGTTPVWVSVLKEVDGRKMTVGESAQIPIQVINPKLKLAANKQDPFIGEKVVITVQDEPKMGDDIITFWWEIKGDATSPGPEPNIPNNRAYSFKPKNNKPVTVTVHGKAKEDGSDLGQADITVNPKTYAVTIGDPRYLGPKPKIWKCDTQLGGQCPGLVDVGDQQFAVFHDVFMKATVNPALSGARYQWAIDPAGTCGMPGAGDEIKMNCSDTGTFTVSLKVSNSDGDQVGEASRQVTISVSQKDLDGSKKAKEAQEKLLKAKGLVAEGKLDEAIALANEAAGLDPKNTEAKTLSQKWGAEKQTVTQQLEKAKKLITENQFDQAEKEFTPAQKLHPKYPPIVETEKFLKTKKEEYKKGVADKLNKARELAKQGKLDEAIVLAEDAAKTDKAGAAPVLAELSALSKKQGWDHVNNRNFKDAVKRLEDAVRLNPTDQDAKSKLDQARKFAGVWPQVEQKAKEFDQLITEKKVFSAQKKMLEVQELQREMPGGMANPLSKKVTDDFNKALQEYNEFRKGVEQKYTEYFKEKNWEEGQKLVQESLKREVSPADEKTDRSRLAQCQQMLGEQKLAWDFYQKTKADFDQNKIKEPSKTAQELKQKASVYGDKAPQRQQMVSLANSLEKKSGDDQTRINMAKQLRAEGEALQGQGKTAEAVAKYRESLKYVPDAKLEEHIRTIETKTAKDKDTKVTADRLWKEGTDALNLGKPSEALAKFKESLKYSSSPERVKYVQDLEGRKTEAEKLRSEGTAFQNQGKLQEATGKYRESLKYWPDPSLEEYIKTLETKTTKDKDTKVTADRLWKEGTDVLNLGKPSEALAKFKESLKYSSSPERVKYVQDLEGRKTQAEKLRSEGTAFQNQGKLQEAAGKYRESLGYWPDPALADHIAKIEAEIKKQETQVVTQPPTSGSGGVDGTWDVSFNNFRGKMELQRSGSSWSGRIWLDAHQRWEQLTNISYSSTGRLEFTRPISGATQRYSGALSGERLDGTFTQEGSSGKYTWWAKRTLVGGAVSATTTTPTGSATGSTPSPTGSFPLQVVRNVPNQNSSAFKQNVRKDLSIDTTSWDKIPYSMHVSSHDLVITTPGKFCLAGDAGGTKGWSVDNFLLIEVLDQSGNLISSAVAGVMETVRRNGNPIEKIGRSSHSFDTCEIDVTKLLPVGRPFRLSTSAMDYGGVGYVSDVFVVSSGGTSGVVSQPTPQPSTAPSQYYHVDLTPYGGKKGTARKVKDVEVDDGSWVRLKATDEKRLTLAITLPRQVTANGVAVVTNLDNAHNVPDGFSTTVLTVITTSGERRFEFKAGVHSSEWNRGETGGAEHKWPKETYIGDKRWMAVFALPQGSVVTGLRFDHKDTDKKYYHGSAAVGFCLRGITLLGGAVSPTATTASTGSSTAPTTAPTAKGNVIFTNSNIGGVYNNPTRATVFTLREPHIITLIQNYHWNDGRGATPGTIALRGSDGQTYGPWRASGTTGQGGAANLYWNAAPNVALPAGSYTVIDSNPATWAQNSESGGAGFTRVEGYPGREVR